MQYQTSKQRDAVKTVSPDHMGKLIKQDCDRDLHQQTHNIYTSSYNSQFVGIHNPLRCEAFYPLTNTKVGNSKFDGKSTFKHDYASEFHKFVIQGPVLTSSTNQTKWLASVIQKAQKQGSIQRNSLAKFQGKSVQNEKLNAVNDGTPQRSPAKMLPQDSLLSSVQMGTKINIKSHNNKEAENFMNEAKFNQRRQCIRKVTH